MSSKAPASRAQIAAATGLTRATAGALVDQLLAGHLLQEIALPRTQQRGRPATGLTIATAGPRAVGLEINIDYIAVTVVDLQGSVVLHEVHAGDQRSSSPDEVMAAAACIAATAVRTARQKGGRITGLALALPGLLLDGRVLLAPNLGWKDVDVTSPLHKSRALSRVPIRVGNEANFAALSQITANCRSFLHVSGEVGIGAALVRDSALQSGSHGWAGELGHATYQPDGPLCSCGATGCLEMYAGQEAISRAAGFQTPPGTLLGGATSELAGAAARGERRALRALAVAGTALGTVLASAVNLLDVRTVYLGGVYESLASWMLPTLQAELQRRVLWAELDAPSIQIAAHGPAAATIGAARAVIADVLAEPERWLTR